MDQAKINLLLRVLATPSMVLTEGQMLGVLELSGIVGNPDAIKAMHFAAGQASATTPATLLGFASTLQGLIKLNPDHTPADYASLEAYIKQISSTGSDVPLTYGIFLKLLDGLPSAPLVPVKPAATAPASAATVRRSPRRRRKA